MTGTGPVDLGPAERHVLIDVATEAVRHGVESGDDEPPSRAGVPEALLRLGASFVTLRRHGNLLGCIGTIEPHRPLVEDVAHNAWSAAFADPRLPAVTAADLPELDVKVSVLGPLEPVDVTDFEALRAVLRPGVDGLLIDDGRHRATFLPSVWEQIPEPEQYLDQLWLKAGLRPRHWTRGMRVWRYGTVEF